MSLKRVYARILLFLALVLAIVRKALSKTVALVLGLVKKAYARIRLVRGKKSYIEFLIVINISLLLLTVAILAFTLIVPSGQTVVQGSPIRIDYSHPSNSSNELPDNGSNNELPDNNSSNHLPDNNSSQPFNPTLKLGVYKDYPYGNQVEALSAIDWSADGPIIPGEIRNSSTVYFRNEGDVAVRLYLSSESWSFGDYLNNTLAQDYRQYFSLSWDYDYSELGVNQVRPVIFSLAVSPLIVDVATFSFGMVVGLSY